MSNRVVITGMGIWSCLGQDLNTVTESLRNGVSGIIFDEKRKGKGFGFRSALTSAVPMPDLKPFVGRDERKYMHEESSYAYMATIQALEQAGLDMDYLSSHEVGILYGNDSVSESTVGAWDKIRSIDSTAASGSGAIFRCMNSSITMNLACLFKLRGVNMTVSAACASGSHSIGLGWLLISQGLQDCIVCGGAQEVNPYATGPFDGLQTFSTREDDPTKACRPFDRDRDGLIPGGGAATVILESYDNAVKRGAHIIAEVMGYGFSGNGDHMTTPSVEGPQRSLEMAIRLSGVDIRDIGYINAHATSTKIGDAREAQAIDNVFHGLNVPVTSTKSQTGHEMWMAGTSELIYSTLMMKNGFIAGNINFENPDEDTAILNIIPETREAHFNMFLSNSFGFGGTNATLIVRNIN